MGKGTDLSRARELLAQITERNDRLEVEQAQREWRAGGGRVVEPVSAALDRIDESLARSKATSDRLKRETAQREWRTGGGRLVEPVSATLDRIDEQIARNQDVIDAMHARTTDDDIDRTMDRIEAALKRMAGGGYSDAEVRAQVEHASIWRNIAETRAIHERWGDHPSVVATDDASARLAQVTADLRNARQQLQAARAARRARETGDRHLRLVTTEGGE